MIRPAPTRSPGFRNEVLGRSCAFTFVELVIVMAIAAIIGAIALPRYAQAISHYRLANACNRIAADINAARSLAMATSQSQTIAFNSTTNSYTVTGLTSLANNGAAYSVNLTGDTYGTAITGAIFGSSQPNVTFDVYGNPNFPGFIYLTCGGVPKIVSVDAAGKVAIQ